jgi:Ca-activated chloride channel family protein
VTFQRPELLVLAPLTAILLALALGAHWRRLNRLVQGYSAPAVGRLLPVRAGRFPTVRLLCLAVGGTAIGLAAAGPEWTLPEPEQPQPPLDVAIAVDLSLSMSAADAAPSRMGRAREVIARLSEELPSVRFSLVVFAGWPYMLLPPTDDHAVLEYFARSLDVELVARLDRGTSLGDALELARYTLDARARPDALRRVLLLSDGGAEEGDPVVEAARSLASEGVEVWVGALGSEAGTPLFLDGAPLVDGGAPVVAALNESLLRQVADAGAGRYVNVTSQDGLASLVEGLRALSGDTEGPPPPPLDAAHLLIILAIPLFLWETAADRCQARSASDEKGAAS